MKELRESIRKMEEDSIQSKKSQFEDYLIDKELQPHKFLSNNISFIKYIEENEGHMLWHILTNAYNQQFQQQISIQIFKQKQLLNQVKIEWMINEIVEAMKSFHSDINEDDLNIHCFNDQIKQIYEKIKLLEKNALIKTQENYVLISYVKDKYLFSDIFNHYRLKYKIVNDKNELLSVYSQNNAKVCLLPINGLTDNIEIKILGKRIKSSINQFQTIASVNVNFLDILFHIKAKNFMEEIIPSGFQTLSYSCDELNLKEIPFQLKFDIRVNLSERIKILNRFINFYQQQIEELEQNVQNKLQLIDEILLPFNGEIVYVRSQGIQKLRKSSQRQCSECNII